jgi:hypothetical protein
MTKKTTLLSMTIFLYRTLVEMIRIPGVVTRRIKISQVRTNSVSEIPHGDQSDPSQIFSLIQKLSPNRVIVPTIRIGPKFDGGYLVPEELDDIKAVFSPGVGNTIGFEKHFADQGIQCFLADASVRPPEGISETMSFESVFIGGKVQPGWQTLESWVNSHVGETQGELILQMDIEGGEYEVINETDSKLLKRFQVVVIELHNLHEIYTRQGMSKVDMFIEKLLQTHNVVHTHANNCELPIRIGNVLIPPVIELTLLEKTKYTILNERNIGEPNTPRFRTSNRNCWYWPEISLEKIWGSIGGTAS